jgi:hypothetical protein
MAIFLYSYNIIFLFVHTSKKLVNMILSIELLQGHILFDCVVIMAIVLVIQAGVVFFFFILNKVVPRILSAETKVHFRGVSI